MADKPNAKQDDFWNGTTAIPSGSPSSVTPASSGNDDDWKIWQAGPQESAPQPGLLSRLGHALTAPIGSHFDKYNEETQKLHDIANGPPTIEQSQHPIKNFIHRTLAGTEADIADQLTPLFVATVGGSQATKVPGAVGKLAKVAMTIGGAGFGVNGAHDIWSAGTENTPDAWGQRIGGAAQIAGGLAGMAPASADAVGAVRTAAVGDRDAAALKGIGIGPKSPKGVRMVRNIEASRPYLGGVENQADLQSRVPIAKAEIIKPYADAVASLKDKVVSGPEGRTTVGALDAKRNELSAQLDSLRGKSPEQQAILLRQGKTPTDLIAEKQAVEKALLPEIAQTGIDPQAILRQYGQVSEVGRTVSGRTTLAAPDKPYGFGKMAQFDITHPFQAPANIASGVRDLAAGRPWWSGKPTDINIREGFGGPALQKPDFGQFTPQPVRNQFGGLSQVEGPPTPYQGEMVTPEAARNSALNQKTRNQFGGVSRVEGPASGPDVNSAPKTYKRITNLGQQTPREGPATAYPSEMVTPEMAKNSATNQGVHRKFGPTETKTGPPAEYEGKPVTPEESKQESVSRAKRRNPYR